jgi:hypothetical protein
MDTSVILFGANQFINNNIAHVSYYLKSNLDDYYEEVQGVYKLHKREEALEEEEYNISYLCWKTEEKVVKGEPPYLIELKFIEPIDPSFKIREVWILIINRLQKAFIVDSEIDGNTVRCYTKSLIKEVFINL